MNEFKGTKGKWYLEVTTEKPTDDFQARILSNLGKEYHAGEIKDKIYIIAGEPQRQNGQANIHSKANALLISKAPEMLEMLEKHLGILKDLHMECDGDDSYLKNLVTLTEHLIKEATTL